MALYPTITAGQRITAGLLRSMLEDFIVKPSSTDRASTTSFADDPDLTYAVAANTVWYVRFVLHAAALAAADIKTDWTVPSGVSGNRAVLGPGSTAADSAADNIAMRAGVHGFGTSILYNGVRNSASLHFLIVEEAVVEVGATAGSIAIRWAQGTSDATATQVRAGSFMEVKRLA